MRFSIPRLLPPVAALAAAGVLVLSHGARAQGLAGDAEYGAFLAGECVTCHQESGDFDGIPPIVGWPVESFVHAMELYKDGTRENQVMRTIAARYGDEELAALAAYFAALGPGKAENPR
ncbi:c-type cytochrome [Salinarimonas chemoclinalis]|uniref:c-type cytochrome n=1 Tax=Salinarimonas chemoclinalis TaxID=3241599 RepID=UPI003558BFA5